MILNQPVGPTVYIESGTFEEHPIFLARVEKLTFKLSLYHDHQVSDYMSKISHLINNCDVLAHVFVEMDNIGTEVSDHVKETVETIVRDAGHAKGRNIWLQLLGSAKLDLNSRMRIDSVLLMRSQMRLRCLQHLYQH